MFNYNNKKGILGKRFILGLGFAFSKKQITVWRIKESRYNQYTFEAMLGPWSWSIIWDNEKESK